jgi:hypothetical protein
VCPHHKTGIFGLLLFMFLLFHQPTLHGTNEQNNYLKRSVIFLKYKLSKLTTYVTAYFNLEVNLFHQTTYFFFIMCMLYTTTFLPYGRFYHRIGGNDGMLGAYIYVLMYLSFSFFRRSLLFDYILLNIYVNLDFLRNKFSYDTNKVNLIKSL